MANILITGGTGYIGSALCKQLIAHGHSVAVLTRGKSKISNGIEFIHYSTNNISDNSQALLKTDVLIHLAGLNVNTGFRWTENIRKELLNSRVLPLKALKTFFADNNLSPHIISASGVTHYTDEHTGHFNEKDDTTKSNNFLAEVCRQWEYAALEMQAIGCKVSIIRTSVVLEKDNAVMQKLKTVSKIPFLALPFSGKQAFPWIALQDLLNIYTWVANTNATGIYNAVSPANNTLSDVLSYFCGKEKFILPLPPFILKWIFGDKSALFLQGAFLEAQALHQKDFEFSVKNLGDL